MAGGLFDQPGGYILRMENVIRAEQEQAKTDEARAAAEAKVEAEVRK